MTHCSASLNLFGIQTLDILNFYFFQTFEVSRMRLFAILALSQGLLAQNDPAEPEAAKQPEKPPAKPQSEPKSDGSSKRIETEKPIDNISAQDILPKIAESEFCSAQVAKLCSKKVQKDDYLVYNCLEQAASNGKLVDDDCQHFLWIWKKSQTANPHIQEMAMTNCRQHKVAEIAQGTKKVL